MGLTGQDFSSRITGSAFVSDAANTITAPEGQSIIGIQFMGVTVLSALIAKDSTKTINTAASAHSTGSFTRTVNQSNATTAKIIFDQENTVSNESEIKIGDEVYDGATGVLHGTVTVLDPDGDNTKEITISASVAITNNETLVFKRPNNQYVNGVGVGGLTVANDNAFPAGSTIYGRWDSVSMQSDDTDGGIIVYFGE
tara:strand:- start:255 stop:848 length:594 start_codon:yes stop_codon:yes gene_type:complete